MYIQIVKHIMKIRKINKAEIAKLAGISRAAVTKWFSQEGKNDWVNVETKTIIQLAEHLHLSPEIFLQKRVNLDRMSHRFLWDSLYPDMESFIEALSKHELPALARLVQVLGFREAKDVVGKSVLELFPKYKRFIKPMRRKELETLWPLYI